MVVLSIGFPGSISVRQFLSDVSITLIDIHGGKGSIKLAAGRALQAVSGGLTPSRVYVVLDVYLRIGLLNAEDLVITLNDI
jgi:hypothetical protein